MEAPDRQPHQSESPSRVDHILFPSKPIHHDAGVLARFLAELTYEEIPADVVHMAKLITLDTVGCIIAGTQTALGREILAAYDCGSAGGGCCIPGTSLQFHPSLAAKINGWLSDVLDYEDTASGHPSATVIPAALAVAERLKATPRQLLAGIVAGYEAGLRVHDATRASPEAYRRFAVYHAWHGVAAGAAAMVVSGGTEEQFRSALGHAAANTNIPLWYVQYGRPAHALKANYGQMALGGVDAALCARQGIIGPFAMLSDSERGFARVIGSDRFDPAQFSLALGEDWRTRKVMLKKFPSCAFLHTTIDAVSQITKANDIDPDDVEKLEIRCFERIVEWFSDRAPKTALDAQFSVEYVAAMALHSIEPGRDWYSPDVFNDAQITASMSKMDVGIDPVAEEAFWGEKEQCMSTVTAYMKDGKSYSANVRWAPGEWQRPLSDADVVAKFLSNVKGTSLDQRGSQVVEKIMHLDELHALNDLTDLLRAS
ncbi:2-methylcitrate dehydratase PrpD [Paraburkholderia sp. BL6669N2]|uniref:MmgE/PrpD family protein n=1 Tax=Paraburkholderia sp. BL6669N2 TaxID=1938807 RepID=UPI000E27F6FA|nr:MmgE/PrpD family protein [Paraburkholderia sp. BL6669N2]REG58645.1 2-methylcitrate dehydratase PrpD [Paraburkholderia sp. BL6669N2]